MNSDTAEAVEDAGPEGHLAYWRKNLAGASALDLPVDRLRGATAGPRDRTALAKPLTVSEEVTAGLFALARREGATLGTTLLAAFGAFLARHSGQDHVVIGVPTRVQGPGEVASVNEAFDTVVAMRLSLAGDPTFSELLDRTAGVCRSGLAHALRFEQVAAVLDVPPAPGRHPIFQAAFSLSEMARESPAPPSTAAAALPEGLDLALSLREEAGELHGHLHYDPDLFDAATASRLRDRLAVLLADIAAHPNERASSLALVPDAERAAILRQVAPVTFPLTATASEIFEAQVERAPDAVAVVAEAVTLTYRDLNERANRLAHALRAVGVGPDVLVAFCLERTSNPIVAILGILKAGGAYVPIDPSYPPERRAWILEDCKARVALTSRATAGQLEAEAVVVLEDALVSGIPSHSLNLPNEVSLDHLAYVIYTSGSTGRPKGSLIPHRNLVRLMRSTEDWFRFGPEDCWTVFHSFSFDFSVWEMWGAFFYGGRAVVVPHATSRDPSAMVELVLNQGVTVLNQTPSAFKLFMQSVLARGSASPALPLRWIIFGGEALDIPSLAGWFERHGAANPKLVNMYGITETTVHVTYRLLREEDARSVRSVIGVPLRDLTLHVLDRNLELSPIGVIGELFVGGAGLSRGYLGMPAMTAERFVPDPFAELPGARLYRSGDLGRRLPTGEIEYLGRADFQVKIRGFRIELGEIEQLLAKHPAVKDALALVREDAPGDKRLVAYLTLHDSDRAPVETEEVREYLRTRLPDYMIPAAVMVLSSWPLTNNGKLDRAGLPPPEAKVAAEGALAPSSAIEQALAKIWCELLRVGSVGLDDDFFSLGGHSVLLGQLATRLRKEFSVEVSLGSLFDVLTLREMSEMVATLLANVSADDSRLAALLDEVEGLTAEEASALLDQDLPGRFRAS